MAVPKRKTSKARRDKRRASSYRLNKTTVVECPQCHEPKLQHRICKKCGCYHDKEVMEVK